MIVAGTAALVTLLAVEYSPDEELSTRADWPTLLFVLFDGVIALGLTLWLVTFIRRRWPALTARCSTRRDGPRMPPTSCIRSS